MGAFLSRRLPPAPVVEVRTEYEETIFHHHYNTVLQPSHEQSASVLSHHQSNTVLQPSHEESSSVLSRHESTTVHSFRQTTTVVVTRPLSVDGMEAARAAADAVFEAIIVAKAVATLYIADFHLGVTSAAAKGYEAVLRAGAEASRHVMVLIKLVYGGAAALAAEVKLAAMKSPIGVADVSMVVNSVMEVITGICSEIIPVTPSGSGTTHQVSSPMEKLGSLSTLKVSGLLGLMTSAGAGLGYTIPMQVKVTIGVLAVVGQLAQAITLHLETSSLV